MTEDHTLYRSNHDVKIAGVCAGLAEHFDLDPTLVRVVFVVLALAGGFGIALYLILWIMIPVEPSSEQTPANAPEREISL